MKRLSLLVIAGLVCCSFAVQADDDDKIMGNYHGVYHPDWAGKYIRAQVVATSKTAHRWFFRR